MMFAAGVAAIFTYHHVSSHAAPGAYGRSLTVTPQEFEAQLKILRERGCEAVGVDRLVNDVRSGRTFACEVALTFDDGYADAASTAAPLLRRYGDVATFFVTTGYLGTAGHLSKADVGALARDGMQIGAHTVTHADLTALSRGAVAAEIRASRAELQALSGQPVDAFAYPAGRYDAAVESEVRSAGYALAASTDSGPITPAVVTRDNYALPRFRVLHGSGNALVRVALSTAGSGGLPRSTAAVRNIARSRIAGNAPAIAERVAIALLNADFPEPIVKVRVLKTAPAVVAGIMLSGVRFHEAVDRRSFAADVTGMLYRAFTAESSVSEVDVWAVVPVTLDRNAVVSGDMAVPNTRTVFSASVLRTEWTLDPENLGTVYWDPAFLRTERR